ncbi:DUF3578 domain-containing protein [Pontibacter sp. H259]|uniref:McrB family protein n=1 Tax=Pontibacter sp. H259 TaxID=3133421 RepID=UPI0030BB5E28
MSIPKNIEKEHLLKAIEKIDRQGIPPFGDSQYYDVFYNGHTYPPKLIVSYANIEANGIELQRDSFKGGKNTECFNLLEKHGFDIIEKAERLPFKHNAETSFSAIVNKFIKQALSNDLKTNSYPKSYKNLEIRVSFGQGNPARIPWIALLREGQAVSNGIYPVYLYYKDFKLLILAFGLSETQEAGNSWNLNSPIQTIEEFFTHRLKTKPARYGDSFVHSYYFIDESTSNLELDPFKVDQDLAAIIDTYNNLQLGKANLISVKPIKYKVTDNQQTTFNYRDFVNDAREAGLNFSDKLVIRFISSLCTKPFVILTGLAGSGKTKLAQAFSQWISSDQSQVCIVPVGADWTNREPLLGFPNALDSTKYTSPENGALQLLINANEYPEKPYFLILDEMNLSHVERYFADFLSAMESHEAIPLHSSDEKLSGIPKSINLPPNLFLIGTVNIDETTYMFSPKVLDRANAIEFRVNHNEMEAYLGNSTKLNISLLKAKGAAMATDFVRKAKTENHEFNDFETLNSALLSFFRELKNVGAEFGYRTASEIKRFAGVIHSLNTGWSTDEIVDAAIMQKLLPKIHGSRRKIEPSLRTLASLCLVQQVDVVKVLKSFEEINLEDGSIVNYPLSLEKIVRMHKAVVQDGFTSFAEA